MVKIRIDPTRDKILGVAKKLFSRFGFRKTSMDEIAKISRKAKGSLYYHFASKEDLFREVISQEIEIVKLSVSDAIADSQKGSEERLKAYFTTRMKKIREASNYHEMIEADFYEEFEFVKDIRSGFEEWERNKLTVLIEEGIREGAFKPSLETAVLVSTFIMFVRSVEIPLLVQDKYDEFSPYFDDILGMLIKGIK